MHSEQVYDLLIRRAGHQNAHDFLPTTPFDGPLSDMAVAIGGAELGVPGDWEAIFTQNLSSVLDFLSRHTINSPGIAGGIAGLNILVSGASKIFDRKLLQLVPTIHAKIVKDTKLKLSATIDPQKRRVGDYDFIEGLVGIGHYLDLMRDTLPTNQRADFQREIIEALSELADFSTTMKLWIGSNQVDEHYAQLGSQFRKGFLDLGFAHGLLGVYWYLDRHRDDLGDHPERPKLLADIFARVLSQWVDSENLPSAVALPETEDEKHRVYVYAGPSVHGWCYGLPSLDFADGGTARLRTRLRLPTPNEKIPPKWLSQPVVEYGICHGLSGQLLIANSIAPKSPNHSIVSEDEYPTWWEARRYHQRLFEEKEPSVDSFSPVKQVTQLNESVGFWNGYLGAFLVEEYLARPGSVLPTPFTLFGFDIHA